MKDYFFKYWQYYILFFEEKNKKKTIVRWQKGVIL